MEIIRNFLINCEVSLTLKWSENFVITNKAYRKTNVETSVVRINNPTSASVEITDTKLYISVVTLSTQEDNKLLKLLKTEFKRTIKWNNIGQK